MECRIKKLLLNQMLILLGLAFGSIMQAQPAFLRTDSLAQSTMIFHANVGYGISTSKLGDSAWEGIDNTNNSGWAYALRWTRCSNKNSLGYGLYVLGYSDNKKFHLPEIPLVNEKTQITYVAPQISYIKKETSFPNVFGLLDFGIGYLHYTSNTPLPSGGSYHTKYNGIGLNLDLGVEYAFHKNWGAKLEIGGLYTPIRPKANLKNETLPLQPRNKINLFMAFLQVGISTYL